MAPQVNNNLPYNPINNPTSPNYNVAGTILKDGSVAPANAPATPNTGGGNQPTTQTQAPATTSSTAAVPNSVSAPGGAGTSTTNPLPAAANPDSEFETAMEAIAPGQTPSEDQIYAYYAGKNQTLIQGIEDTASAAENAANIQSTKDTSNMNETMNAQGTAGSPEAAAESDTIEQNRSQTIATAEAQKETAIGNILSTIAGQASTDYQAALARNDTNAQAYIKQAQTNLANSLAGLAASGITLDSFQQSNPQAYSEMLQYANGDPNILTDMYISAAASNKKLLNNGNPVVQVGNQLTYAVQSTDAQGNPVVSTITQTLPFNLPATYGWTANKVGTTLTVMTDPNNPANTISYATNPFTGEITINGSGSGLQALQAAGIQSGSTVDSSGNPITTNNGTGAGTASTTVSNALGVDPSTSLSDVVAKNGLGAIVAAMIKNEGGSPAGVQNNPGNIKFNGGPGQTDSGVKAPDGGTYASYDTYNDGEQAVGQLVQSAASGQSSAYGQIPTLQSFVDKYTNTGSANSTVSSSTGLSTSEYGLLANVNGFNPTTPGVDADAWNYLQKYLSTGTTPTAASVGISTRTGSGQAFNSVVERADDVYFQATGQHLPNASVLSSNLGLISTNNSLLNNLKVQEGTISKNFGLNLENLNANNVNQAAPAINSTLDALAKASGSTSVAQYLAQNETIQNELGSLLALKNAGGTTVADKLSAGDLLPSDLSADQQKVILSTLLKEASNQQQSIGKATADLYAQTDPLGLDPNNPINAPGYKQMTSSGFTDNYDGTWTDSSGTSGYTIQGNTMIGPDGTQYDLTQ